ncbi:MAG TPA: hypothetical protein VJ732_11680 [Bryobacteraceae bacterium]|nr:hypothetical protein [Bryobacteraceae bacterium]
MRIYCICFWAASLGAPLCDAQWIDHRDASIPRTRDGKPNLSASVPRTHGRPDLSGIWEVESSPAKEVEPYLLPGGINGLGEDTPSKYFLNFFFDFGFGKEPFRPEAAALFQQRMRAGERPATLCPPPSLPVSDMNPAPFRIIQQPKMIVFLYEGDTSFFRQIFTDGRQLPEDPQPTWLGYSVAKWEGDWLVVNTTGFNDKGPLDAMGHFHSEQMRLTERIHRRDIGHLEMELTVDDPKTYTKPVTDHVNFRLLPDTELLESFCSEGEQDLSHIRGQ